MLDFILVVTSLYLKVLNSPTWFRERERVSLPFPTTSWGLPFSLSTFLAFISGFLNNTLMLLFPEFSVWGVTRSPLSLERVSSLSPPTKWCQVTTYCLITECLHYGICKGICKLLTFPFFFFFSCTTFSFGGDNNCLAPHCPPVFVLSGSLVSDLPIIFPGG